MDVARCTHNCLELPPLTSRRRARFIDSATRVYVELDRPPSADPPELVWVISLEETDVSVGAEIVDTDVDVVVVDVVDVEEEVEEEVVADVAEMIFLSLILLLLLILLMLLVLLVLILLILFIGLIGVMNGGDTSAPLGGDIEICGPSLGDIRGDIRGEILGEGIVSGR